jgi:PAS domain S-box-containing protein
MLRRVLATVREPRFRLSLGAGFGVVTVLLAVLGLVTYWNTSRLIEASRLVEHTRDVIGQLEVLFSSLKDAEAGQRGYVITGLPSHLEPYKSAVATVRPTLNQIGRLTSDNPAQHDRAVRLGGLVSEKLALLQNNIDLRDRAGIEAAAAGIATGTEKATMEQIRALIGQMQAEERGLLQTRSADTKTTARTAIVTLSLGTALLFTFLGLIWALLRLDLLKRHAAEEELRQSEAELRTTLRSIGDAVIATDRTGKITFVNPVAERLTGWSEEEAAGRDPREVFRIVHEVTRAEVESPIFRALREGAVAGLADHAILVARDGTERPIADSGAPIRDERGEVNGVVLVFRDITATRQAERDLQRLASIVSSSSDAIVGEDLDGSVTAWNDAAERLFGYSAEEMIGGSTARLETPELKGNTAKILERIRKGERVQQFDTTRVRKNGQTVAVSVSWSPIRDAEGTIVGASKIARDITKRKEAERALQASEEGFRTLSDAVTSLVWVCNDRGEAEYLNHRWYEYTGLSSAESLGNGWLNVIHPDDAAQYLETWRKCVETGVRCEIEARYRRADGAYRWFVARASRIEIGASPLWIGTSTDIDDLKNTAAALSEAKEAAEQANQAKDRFLAILSHELRTPLTPALASAQVLETRADLPADLRQLARVIRRNVELQALLVDDLLDLTRIAHGKIELRREAADLHVLIESVADICRSEVLAKRQRLELSLRAEEHHAEADSARMQQVLWNLLKNAIKFTGESGSITVTTQNPAPGTLRIRIADTGIGIDAAVLDRIFEPFEQGTARSSHRQSGLGLGLSISKTLVDLHGGTVRAESAGLGQGAVFTVDLPTFQERRLAAPAGLPGGVQRPRQTLSILVVEDHADTAEALSQLLGMEGHSVKTAGSVAEAIAAFRDQGFDLLITDLGLPDGSGHDLLSALRRIRPVQGIVLSGYGMDSDLEMSKAAGFVDHLIKPVNVRRLLHAIDRLGRGA